jgi:bifunctional non-homologous end joining protein LigD
LEAEDKEEKKKVVMKIKVGKYNIEITNSEKILFPKSKIKKQELVEYYHKIAPIMLPHIKNRPITMDRYPNGVTKATFYQKDAPDFFPDYIARQPVKKSGGGSVDYALITNEAGIVYLGNYVCVPHIWLSHTPKLNYPDRMIFDLDPSPGVSFGDVKWAAVVLKKVLEALKLPTFVMTTGSRGLHVVVPLKPTMLFDKVRDIAQDIAQYLVDQYPKKLTLEVRKNKRGKRIFVDTLRNAWSATAVAPYAVRAKEGAPVATPLQWQEVSRLKSAQDYTIKNIFQRLARKKDPWRDINKKAVTLAQAKKKIDDLIKRS